MADDTSRPKATTSDADVPGDLCGAQWLRNASCQAVFDALESGGYPAKAVGGAVRNTLMGLEVADVDIATPAHPEVVMRLCGERGLSVHATGIAHGTITVVSDHVPYEVTTLRRDVATDGRRATVAYTKDWAEDAGRRDFSMNAIYCDRYGEIHDPLGGLSDVRNRCVRFIGSAGERIREDYLRILRFFRFFAAYGVGDIDPGGLQACVEETEGLRSLSAERIGSELLKLLVAPRALEALEKMQASGIDRIVTGQNSNFAVFEKFSSLVTQMGVAADPIDRLAALATQDEEDARALAMRLRLSNAERKQLARMSEVSGESQFASDSAQRIALYRLGEEAYRSSCLMAWARSQASFGDATFQTAFSLPDRWQPGAMPFQGSDVISRGVIPGPAVGQILKEFEDWWISSDFPRDQDRLEGKFAELVTAVKK